MSVILGIIFNLRYIKTLTVLINGTKPLNRVYVLEEKNPVSLTPTGFHLVAETGFEPVTFGL